MLLNPSKQAASLASELKYIASLIVQSRMWEDLYARRYETKTAANHGSFTTSHAEYKRTLEELYRMILKMQITSYCYYAKPTAFRLGRDIISWDNWVALGRDIREQERVFVAVSAIWRDGKFDEESEATQRRHQEMSTRWEAIGSDVQGLRRAVEAAQADDTRQELLSWLCDMDLSSSYNIACEKHQDGTGGWLLQNKKFQTWQLSPGSLLWLHGKGMCGFSPFYVAFTEPARLGLGPRHSGQQLRQCRRRLTRVSIRNLADMLQLAQENQFSAPPSFVTCEMSTPMIRRQPLPTSTSVSPTRGSRI